MRQIMEPQLKIGQSDIANIEIDLSSRDEIPQLLLGLQAIYNDKSARQKVFDILEDIIPDDTDVRSGRPGMDLWNIFVLGIIRLNANWDYDKLHDIANNHRTIREFLGHSPWDIHQTYGLQTIKDNVRLFTPEILERINVVVVTLGHQIVNLKTDEPLKGRADSFVVETDVHFPTDINLLLDATRKVLKFIHKESASFGITEWRKAKAVLKKIKKLFNKARRLKPSNSKDENKKLQRQELIIAAHTQYVDFVEKYIIRAEHTLNLLRTLNTDNVTRVLQLEKFIAIGYRQIDQIRRRVLNDETIAHHEKLFSVFQEHTEWISKGKAGVPQELGLRVAIVEDQFGFILHHHVMEKLTDDKIAVPLIKQTKANFAALDSCSFDKGFYTPENRQELQNHLDLVVLPKKGRLSSIDKQIEHADDFVEARSKHSAVESAINAIENHGLDRCLDHGIAGFKRYVALAVLARNIQIIGAKIRQQELKKRKRQRVATKSRFLKAA